MGRWLHSAFGQAPRLVDAKASQSVCFLPHCISWGDLNTATPFLAWHLSPLDPLGRSSVLSLEPGSIVPVGSELWQWPPSLGAKKLILPFCFQWHFSTGMLECHAAHQLSWGRGHFLQGPGADGRLHPEGKGAAWVACSSPALCVRARRAFLQMTISAPCLAFPLVLSRKPLFAHGAWPVLAELTMLPRSQCTRPVPEKRSLQETKPESRVGAWMCV